MGTCDRMTVRGVRKNSRKENKLHCQRDDRMYENDDKDQRSRELGIGYLLYARGSQIDQEVSVRHAASSRDLSVKKKMGRLTEERTG
jgi:hypothetical protein